MKDKKRDMWAGGALIVFSTINLIATGNIELSSMNILPSNVFPRICLTGLLLIGIALFVKSFIFIRKEKGASEPVDKISNGSYVRVWLVMAVLAVCILLLRYIGFILMGFLYLFTTILILFPEKPKAKNFILISLVSIVIPVAVFFLFTRIFQLLLPVGSLWR